MPGASASTSPVARRAPSAGTTVTAISIEAKIEAEIAIAMSEYSWPASSSISRIGANTRIVVSVDASTAFHTRCTPSTAASKRSSPRRRAWSMLSSTTMVLSTVMPIANATPAIEITLSVRPASSRPTNAAIVQIGIAMTPVSVARPERRNANITSVASSAPSARLVQTLATESST